MCFQREAVSLGSAFNLELVVFLCDRVNARQCNVNTLEPRTETWGVSGLRAEPWTERRRVMTATGGRRTSDEMLYALGKAILPRKRIASKKKHEHHPASRPDAHVNRMAMPCRWRVSSVELYVPMSKCDQTSFWLNSKQRYQKSHRIFRNLLVILS
jgi:hypothetical protein